MHGFKFTSAMITRGFATFFGNSAGYIGGSISTLYIMKGTLPTPGQGLALTSSYIVSRTDDVLTSYTLDGQFKSIVGNVAELYPLGYVKAAKSGQATWFAIVTNGGFAVYGDISDLNGSGYLRFADTNIVMGTAYKVDAIKVALAHEYVTG